ncbi:MAG: SBBP repeat-containing protein [Planctomycetota bacterium]
MRETTPLEHRGRWGLVVGSLLVGSLLGLGGAGGGVVDSGAPPRSEGPSGQSDTPLNSRVPDAERDRVAQAFGKLPLYFIENQGQLDGQVAYYVKGADKTLYFTKEGVTFSLQGEDQRWTVKLEFVGANADVVPRGEEKQAAIFSYFKGKPEEWKTGCLSYAKVVYEDLWPGIDLVYQGTVNRLKYEFIVDPGADPSQIRLAYRGATQVAVSDGGALQIQTPVADLVDARPLGYQDIDGKRADVSVSYAIGEDLEGAWLYGFEIGAYDRSLPLVLDPAMLVYCGYIGGTDEEWANGIAVDGSGAAYVTGLTRSSESEGFPVLVGPELTFDGGWGDAFVAKVHVSGATLLYCGYIGGIGDDLGDDIEVDGSGAAYLMGSTSSSESEGFPVLVGPDLTLDGDYEDAFVAKIHPSGAKLEYCGYIGGMDYDSGYGIGVDGSGAAYVTGLARSSESEGFPVLVGPDLTFNGTWDAFVAKVHPSGATFVYCGYIGGLGGDDGYGIAVDGSGGAYVTGETWSSESEGFPVLVGPDLSFNEGSTDAFVAKVDPSGATLAYCGYIGGTIRESGEGVALDGSGAAYVTGGTASSESGGFPVVVGPDLTFNGVFDCFVAKVPALDQFPASWANYGSGWPGTNGIPCFTASNDPILCSAIALEICNSLGAPTSAFLLIGFAPASIPTRFGGTLLVLPRWIYSIPLLAGITSLPGEIPCDAALAGLHLYLQVLEMDPGASHGISFTPGLELVFGYY